MLRISFVSAALILALLVVLHGSASAQQDITPPYLVDMQFEPQFIDTGDGPKTITVTVHVTDDLSGLYSIAFSFKKADTTQDTGINFNPASGIGTLVEGTLTDAWIVNTMTLPQYSAYGDWELTSVSAEDNVGNRVSCYKPDDPDDDPNAPQCDIPFGDYSFYVGEYPSPEPPSPQDRALFLPLMR